MPSYTKCSNCRKRIPKGTVCECRKERYKEYNKRVRFTEDNKKYADFYNTGAWHRLSRHIKIKYSGLCLVCLIKYKEITAADVVHHIEEIRSDWDLRLREDNLVPLCHRCHNTLHSNYTEKEKEGLHIYQKLYSDIYI